MGLFFNFKFYHLLPELAFFVSCFSISLRSIEQLFKAAFGLGAITK